MNECSRLLTLCDFVLLNGKPSYQDFAKVCDIYEAIDEQKKLLEKQIRDSKLKCEDKGKIKAMESSKEYLTNCCAQLDNLLRGKGFTGSTFLIPVEKDLPAATQALSCT